MFILSQFNIYIYGVNTFWPESIPVVLFFFPPPLMKTLLPKKVPTFLRGLGRNNVATSAVVYWTLVFLFCSSLHSVRVACMCVGRNLLIWAIVSWKCLSLTPAAISWLSLLRSWGLMSLPLLYGQQNIYGPSLVYSSQVVAQRWVAR